MSKSNNNQVKSNVNHRRIPAVIAAEAPPTEVDTSQSSEVAASLGFSIQDPLAASTIRRLRKALPGYALVLEGLSKRFKNDSETLRVKNVTPKDIDRVLAEREPLENAEAVLAVAQRAAYEQRLVLDDRAIAMMRKINKAVQDSENLDLQARYKFLRDYLAAFAGGGNKTVTPAPEAPAPVVKS